MLRSLLSLALFGAVVSATNSSSSSSATPAGSSSSSSATNNGGSSSSSATNNGGSSSSSNNSTDTTTTTAATTVKLFSFSQTATETLLDNVTIATYPQNMLNAKTTGIAAALNADATVTGVSVNALEITALVSVRRLEGAERRELGTASYTVTTAYKIAGVQAAHETAFAARVNSAAFASAAQTQINTASGGTAMGLPQTISGYSNTKDILTTGTTSGTWYTDNKCNTADSTFTNYANWASTAIGTCPSTAVKWGSTTADKYVKVTSCVHAPFGDIVASHSTNADCTTGAVTIANLRNSECWAGTGVWLRATCTPAASATSGAVSMGLASLSALAAFLLM